MQRSVDDVIELKYPYCHGSTIVKDVIIEINSEIEEMMNFLELVNETFEWTAYEEDGDLHIGIRTDYSGEMLPGFMRDEEGMQFRYWVNPQVITIGHLRIDVQYIEDKHIGKVAIITDNNEKTETEMRVVLSEPKKEYTTSQKAVAVLTDKGFKAETFPAMNDDVMLYVNTEMFILSETDVCRLAEEYDKAEPKKVDGCHRDEIRQFAMDYYFDNEITYEDLVKAEQGDKSIEVEVWYPFERESLTELRHKVDAMVSNIERLHTTLNKI